MINAYTVIIPTIANELKIVLKYEDFWWKLHEHFMSTLTRSQGENQRTIPLWKRGNSNLDIRFHRTQCESVFNFPGVYSFEYKKDGKLTSSFIQIRLRTLRLTIPFVPKDGCVHLATGSFFNWKWHHSVFPKHRHMMTLYWISRLQVFQGVVSTNPSKFTSLIIVPTPVVSNPFDWPLLLNRTLK